mmetsp:Transcript_3698/g.10135  ORF Transcript_3698/g.10135 Transcript_3698/m.10135 type:complete len:512 (-) Transcript_3698:563-2098(-)
MLSLSWRRSTTWYLVVWLLILSDLVNTSLWRQSTRKRSGYKFKFAQEDAGRPLRTGEYGACDVVREGACRTHPRPLSQCRGEGRIKAAVFLPLFGIVSSQQVVRVAWSAVMASQLAIDVIVSLAPDMPHVMESTLRYYLRKLQEHMTGRVVIRVDPWFLHADDLPSNLLHAFRNEKNCCSWKELQKLLVFNETKYDRIVVLDSDIVLMENIDDVFRCPDPVFASGMRANLNGGFFAVTPSKDDAATLRQALITADYDPARGWGRCGTQFSPLGEKEYGEEGPQGFLYYHFGYQQDRLVRADQCEYDYQSPYCCRHVIQPAMRSSPRVLHKDCSPFCDKIHTTVRVFLDWLASPWPTQSGPPHRTRYVLFVISRDLSRAQHVLDHALGHLLRSNHSRVQYPLEVNTHCNARYAPQMADVPARTTVVTRRCGGVFTPDSDSDRSITPREAFAVSIGYIPRIVWLHTASERSHHHGQEDSNGGVKEWYNFFNRRNIIEFDSFSPSVISSILSWL